MLYKILLCTGSILLRFNSKHTEKNAKKLKKENRKTTNGKGTNINKYECRLQNLDRGTFEVYCATKL